MRTEGVNGRVHRHPSSARHLGRMLLLLLVSCVLSVGCVADCGGSTADDVGEPGTDGPTRAESARPRSDSRSPRQRRQNERAQDGARTAYDALRDLAH